MANMIPISTVTVGSGGASTFEFNSIPQIYTDLVIKVSARSNRVSNYDFLAMRFNGSATGYIDRQLYSDGTAVQVNIDGIGNTYIFATFFNGASSTANSFGNAEIYIPNYTATSYKIALSDGAFENNSAQAILNVDAGLWANTAPITSISLIDASGTLQQYSTATLYGIRKY